MYTDCSKMHVHVHTCIRELPNVPHNNNSAFYIQCIYIVCIYKTLSVWAAEETF